MKKTKFQEKQKARLQRQAKKKAEPERAKAPKPGRKKPEAFPGAGFPLDWENIRGEDFDEKVKPRLQDFDSIDDKLEFLQLVWDHFAHYCLDGGQSLIKDGFPPVLAALARVPEVSERPEYVFAKKLFDEYFRLEDLRKIEQGTARSARDSRGKPALTAAQCCLAIHYLLCAAERPVSYGDGDTAAQSLIVALTGHDRRNVREYLSKMFSRQTQTRKDLLVLRPYFENLGLSNVVARIDEELGAEDEENDGL